MKKILIISASALFILISGAFSQNLDNILKEHFKASGIDKMANIETQIISGKNIVTAMGMEMPFTITTARPNKIRVESSFQGSKIIQTFNGEKGWMLAPMMGNFEPTVLSETELKMLKSQGDMDGQLWDYKKKGNVVELLGEEVINGAPAYHLKITTAAGDIIHQYIDKASHQITKVSTKQVIGGAETEIENALSDYRMVKGISVAHSIATRMNDQTITTIKIDQVKFNEKVDDSLFDKPSL